MTDLGLRQYSFRTALRDHKSPGKQLKRIKVIDCYCKGAIGIVLAIPFTKGNCGEDCAETKHLAPEGCRIRRLLSGVNTGQKPFVL